LYNKEKKASMIVKKAKGKKESCWGGMVEAEELTAVTTGKGGGAEL
jgi:hypothetical protein